MGALNLIDNEVDLFASTSSEKKKILILEDNQNMQIIIRRIIRKIDPHIKVDWFSNASDAIHSIERNDIFEQQYSLVLADILVSGKLTGMDLWEYCNKYHQHLKFVFMSVMSPRQFMKTKPGLIQTRPTFIRKPFTVYDFKTMMADELKEPLVKLPIKKIAENVYQLPPV